MNCVTYSILIMLSGAIHLDGLNKNWTNPDIFSNKKFPFTHANPLENYDLSSIHAYVQNVLSNVSASDGVLVKTEVFETHQWVLAKIKLPNPKGTRVWVNANRIKIEKAPGGKEQILQLPCRVNPLAKKVLYKKGILEIRMPKLKYNDRYHEIIF